jgi:UDP:flavonoid glycosyltransferase YjiC (YdhE family)
MIVTIIAPGSRGDVQPYVALGNGLKEAGHTVRVVTTTDFQELVTAYGLEFAAMGGNVEAAAQSQITDLLEQGNLLEILASTGRGAQQLAYQAAVRGLEACQDTDLIIGGLGGLFVGLALAEKVGVPFLQAYLVPFTPTRAFPSALMPLPQTPLTTWANGLSHRLTQQMMWQMFRAADTMARTEVLQMAPSPFWGPPAIRHGQAHPILYGFSPQVVPPPNDWDASIHVTGYWFLEPPRAWEPPTDLEHFLQSGSPPIYIGFGSMLSSNPEAAAELVLQALARTGQRGVLYSGWGGLKQEQLPENVFMTGSVPHSWLFPRMAAVVHHGGAGTTAAGLWAGVPAIVTPFFGDQPFWGQRVYALGVGPTPIPRRRLTINNLAEAIQCAVSDTHMRKRASDLGERIRAEHGIAQAVAVIEQNSGQR